MVKMTQQARESATVQVVEVTKEMAKPRFGESSQHSQTERAKPTRDSITHLAYALYLVRGCEHGRDVEDWVKAEKELSDNGQPHTIKATRPASPVWFDKPSICG